MDEPQFDELTKSLAHASSRRGFFKVIAAAIGGALGLGAAEAAPGGSTCANQGQSCTAQKCCKGLICSTDLTLSTNKFCCPEPTRPCNGACVDLQTDVKNCGGCGNACAASTDPCRKAACAAGVCTTVPDETKGS